VLAYATLHWENRRRAGLTLGVALAIWLHISLEGAPLTAAFFVYLGWGWAIAQQSGKMLFWTLCSFAGSSLLLFLGTQPSGFTAPQYCDTVSSAHIWAILGATAILLPAAYLEPASRAVRIGVTGLAGLLAIAILLWLAPNCTQGAFGDLDPAVRSYWYDTVREGLPAWRQQGRTAIGLIAPLIVALLGLAGVWRFADSNKKVGLGTAAFFLIYATILSFLVFRTVSVATAFTIVPAALTMVAVFKAYRTEPRLLARLCYIPVVLVLMTSGILGSALYSKYVDGVTGKAKTKAEIAKDLAEKACASIESVAALAALPPSNLVAPFNLGPSILLTTHHKVLASSHHRNRAGMRDQVNLFRLPPDQAKAIIDGRPIEYVVACPKDPEMERYSDRDPLGLWAQINAGKAPPWLEYRGTMGKGLKVWRVR
jgi:diacylglycerol kinase